MEDKEKVIFRPELILEYKLNATQKRSKLTVKNSDDAILVLEGIKELTTDHLVLIYLDNNDVVAGVDSFICGIDAFDVPQASRALANAIQKQNRESMLKVVLAQTTTQVRKLSFRDLDLEGIRLLAIRLVALQIEIVDFILMGPNGYYSFKEDTKAWTDYQKGVASMKKLLLEEPFFPSLFKYDSTEDV